MSIRKTPSTIIIKVGYTNFAIPFTLERMAVLEDLMVNAAEVSINWNNEIAAVQPGLSKDFSMQILAKDIPEWVEPKPDDETTNNGEQE